jgi:hypothetical protein
MKKLWFFAVFVLIFALFSDPSFARRGSVSPTPKVFTPLKVKPYQPKDFEKGKTNTQQKDINKTQLEKSKLTNQTQNPIYTNPLFRWLVGRLDIGSFAVFAFRTRLSSGHSGTFGDWTFGSAGIFCT